MTEQDMQSLADLLIGEGKGGDDAIVVAIAERGYLKGYTSFYVALDTITPHLRTNEKGEAYRAATNKLAAAWLYGNQGITDAEYCRKVVSKLGADAVGYNGDTQALDNAVELRVRASAAKQAAKVEAGKSLPVLIKAGEKLVALYELQRTMGAPAATLEAVIEGTIKSLNGLLDKVRA